MIAVKSKNTTWTMISVGTDRIGSYAEFIHPADGKEVRLYIGDSIQMEHRVQLNMNAMTTNSQMAEQFRAQGYEVN